MPWYKGNLHCHSTNSDGDLSPCDVVALYKRNGYQFLSITDHNHLTEVAEAEIPDGFLFIKGMEFTYDNVGESYIHINGIGMQREPVISERPRTLVDGMRSITKCINDEEGFAVITHPNWRWGYGADEMARIPLAHAFEEYNGAGACNNEGDSENQSTDKIWDLLLSRGRRILGIACDDAHDYTAESPTYVEPPSTGWICVWAEGLTQGKVMASLVRGDFYSSNHPILEQVTRTPEVLHIKIKEIGEIRYTTSFIGKDGKVLAMVRGLEASYQPDGTEGYVRAVITDTDGHTAWTQPVFLWEERPTRGGGSSKGRLDK
jgi:hypothetical protein